MLVPPQKNFVVWYKSGSGGFFVSWLLQVAQSPQCLLNALEVFPLLLNNNASPWKKYERTPKNIGVLCNMFHPDTYYAIDLNQEIRLTIENLLKEDYSFDNLLHCRIKYYLVNYVYHSGHILPENVAETQAHLKDFHLDNPTYIKKVTDVVCDPARAVFVTAPDAYIKESSRIKKCRYYDSPVNNIITNQPNLVKFRLESTWQDTWLKEIEEITNTKLNYAQVSACQQLVSRYLEIMPDTVKKVVT